MSHLQSFALAAVADVTHPITTSDWRNVQLEGITEPLVEESDVTAVSLDMCRHQSQQRSFSREAQKQYSLIFPSRLPEVHNALDEIRTGSKSCARDSRLHLAADPGTPCNEDELTKRKASRKQLSDMLSDIIDIAQHVADQSSSMSWITLGD